MMETELHSFCACSFTSKFQEIFFVSFSTTLKTMSGTSQSTPPKSKLKLYTKTAPVENWDTNKNDLLEHK